MNGAAQDTTNHARKGKTQEMTKLRNYIENHTWAQWAVAVAFWLALVGILETAYPLIHNGETFHDAFAAWMR